MTNLQLLSYCYIKQSIKLKTVKVKEKGFGVIGLKLEEHSNLYKLHPPPIQQLVCRGSPVAAVWTSSRFPYGG